MLTRGRTTRVGAHMAAARPRRALGAASQANVHTRLNPGVFLFCAFLYLQLPLTFEIAAGVGTPARRRAWVPGARARPHTHTHGIWALPPRVGGGGGQPRCAGWRSAALSLTAVQYAVDIYFAYSTLNTTGSSNVYLVANLLLYLTINMAGLCSAYLNELNSRSFFLRGTYGGGIASSTLGGSCGPHHSRACARCPPHRAVSYVSAATVRQPAGPRDHPRAVRADPVLDPAATVRAWHGRRRA